MKKLICLLLVLLFLPVFSLADSYSPKLKMTVSEFISKYNSIGAPFDSPLLGLKTPYDFTFWTTYNVYWFASDKESGTTILLLSQDPSAKRNSLDCGLDRIQIFTKGMNHFLSFITVASRCASFFAPNVFSVSMDNYYITELIRLFYENNCMNTGNGYYRQMDVEQDNYLYFYSDSDYYYFDILIGDDFL